jgi:hypothetical protein
VAIPEQIRKQTEAVQELYKQLNPERPQGEEQSSADAPDQGEPVAEDPPADSNSETNDAPQQAAEQKPAEGKVPEDTVLQKYKTLQGMYNAEVPRLHQQNREMQQRLQQMEQLLSSMATPQSAPAAAAPEKLVTENDVAEYGDSIEVMRRVSREELSSLMHRLAQVETALKQVNTSIVPQVQAVAQRQAVSAEQQFWADLTSAVPTWRDTNDNSDFQSWLLEADPLTGITRQTYLEDAQRSLDSARVANFFRTWQAQNGQVPVAQSAGQTPAATSELEKQVSPGRSRSAGTASQPKGKMYTPNDITKFFNDVRSGKYKGREQERDRIERDIFAAQRENRIQINA